MPAKTHDFDKVLKENSVQGRTKTTLNHWGVFIGSGLLMVAMPLYIYASPMFDLPLTENIARCAVVSVLGGSLLAWAYRSVSLQRRITLLTTYQSPPAKSNQAVGKKEREEAQANLEKSVADLCCAYALFTVNASFLLLWLSAAFYVLPKFFTALSSSLNHFLAVTGPALLLATKATAAF